MVHISNLAKKSPKYVKRQLNDLKTNKENPIVTDFGVTSDIIDQISPFRRISQKQTSLSDNKYFIDRYEKEKGQDYLPANWSKLDFKSKADYIVKERYSRLVARKIMKSITNNENEIHYSLSADGDILTIDKGNQSSVKPVNLYKLLDKPYMAKKPKISIHNHPSKPDDIILNHLEKTEPETIEKFGNPFGGADLANNVSLGLKTYVTDAFGKMYYFEPKTYISHRNDVADEIYDGMRAATRCLVDYSEEQNSIRYKTLYNSVKQVHTPDAQKEAKTYLEKYINYGTLYSKRIFQLDKRISDCKKIIEENLNAGKIEYL